MSGSKQSELKKVTEADRTTISDSLTKRKGSASEQGERMIAMMEVTKSQREARGEKSDSERMGEIKQSLEVRQEQQKRPPKQAEQISHDLTKNSSYKTELISLDSSDTRRVVEYLSDEIAWRKGYKDDANSNSAGDSVKSPVGIESTENMSHDITSSEKGSLTWGQSTTVEQTYPHKVINEGDQNSLRKEVKKTILDEFKKGDMTTRNIVSSTVKALDQRYNAERDHQQAKGTKDREKLRYFRELFESFDTIADFLSQDKTISDEVSDKDLKISLNFIANHKEDAYKSSRGNKSFNNSVIKDLVLIVKENSVISAYRQS
jgi:hypothetical protein